MSVVLELAPETERILKDNAARGGQTLEAYLEQLAEQDAREISSSQDLRSGVPKGQWVAELRTWAASHRAIEKIVDDSRETIYEGRGE
jgi:hypothetical protein